MNFKQLKLKKIAFPRLSIFGRWSVKYQLILLLIFALALPFFSVLGLFTEMYRSTTTEYEESIFQLSNGLLKSEINNKVEGAFNSVQIIKSQELLYEMLAYVNEEGFSTQDENYISLFKTIDATIENSDGLFEMIFVSDNIGNILSYDSGMKMRYQLLSAGNKKYFTALSSMETTYFGEPFVSPVTGEMVVPLSVAIMENEQLIGSVITYVSLEKLVQNSVGLNSKYIILSKEGWIIKHFIPELVNTKSEYIFEKEKIEISGTSYTHSLDIVGRTGWQVVLLDDQKTFLKGMHQLKSYQLMMSLLMLAIAVAAYIYLNQSIIKPMESLAAGLYSLSKGEFIQLESGYFNKEIRYLKESYSYLIEKIEHLFKKIRTMSNMLSEEAGALNDISTDSFKITEETNVDIEQIATESMEQREALIKGLEGSNEMIQKALGIQQFSKEISVTVDEQYLKTQDGAKLVREVKEEVQEGEKHGDILREKVSELNEAVNQISDINTAISEISRKTNILALNAAIEAARAGESGKGFAVVANEIRTLSDGIAGETKNVKQLIELVKERYNTVDEFMAQNAEIVSKQQNVMEKLRITYQELQDENAKNSEKVTCISNEVDVLIEHMETTTHMIKETSKALNGTTDRSHHLISKSQNLFSGINILNELVEQLKIQSNTLKIELDDFIKEEV